MDTIEKYIQGYGYHVDIFILVFIFKAVFISYHTVQGVALLEKRRYQSLTYISVGAGYENVHIIC